MVTTAAPKLLNGSSPKAANLLSSLSLSNQRILENCSAELLEVASTTCDHIPEQEIRFDCIYDVCVTGDPSAAEDSVDMEILEIKKAHGVVIFEGEGRCLDSAGHLYTQFKTKGTSTDRQCEDILQSLAHRDGVRGAELSRNQTCFIVVDPNLDSRITDRFHKVGWVLEQSGGTGGGIVSNTTETPGWQCWKLI